MNLTDNFSNTLKDYCDTYNLTVADLAKELNFQNEIIENWIEGISMPTVDDLYTICKTIGITIDEALSDRKNKFRLGIIYDFYNELILDKAYFLLNNAYKKFAICENITNCPFNMRKLLHLLNTWGVMCIKIETIQKNQLETDYTIEIKDFVKKCNEQVINMKNDGIFDSLSNDYPEKNIPIIVKFLEYFIKNQTQLFIAMMRYLNLDNLLHNAEKEGL